MIKTGAGHLWNVRNKGLNSKISSGWKFNVFNLALVELTLNQRNWHWLNIDTSSCVAYSRMFMFLDSGSIAYESMNGASGHLLCRYRLNCVMRTSWEWSDDSDDTALQIQDSKFDTWQSKAEHATSRSPWILYRIKPKELYILSCGKGRGRRPRPFPQLKM